MLSSIENGIQLAVTCGCAVIALYYGVLHKERIMIMLGLFYGIFFLGDLYWQLYIIFYDDASPKFYVSYFSWYSSYLFLLLLLIYVNVKSVEDYRFRLRPGFLCIPVFTGAMCAFYMQWGDYISNIITFVLMTGLIWHAVYGLTRLHRHPGQGEERRMLYVATLVFCGIEYALWTSSCFNSGDLYYWIDILLSLSFVPFLPAVRKAVGR